MLYNGVPQNTGEKSKWNTKGSCTVNRDTEVENNMTCLGKKIFFFGFWLFF